jgi:Helix-turn-helix.
MADRQTIRDLIAAVAKPGETVTDWSLRVGFPVRTLSRILNGHATLRLGTLTLLAKALGVKPARLRALLTARG